MEAPHMDNLGQYGAVGVILTVLLGLFIWAFKVLFGRLITHFDTLSTFMAESNRRAEANHQAIMGQFQSFFSELAKRWLDDITGSHNLPRPKGPPKVNR